MSTNRSFVAGVDSSTQSCKVVIADPVSGDIIRTGSALHPPGTEVDPEAWWEALQEAIAAAGGLDDVAGLSISGQQHGLVALDAQGQVIRDALLWNDLRSKAAARDLIAEVGASDYVARTGILPVASFTAAKLRWLRDAEPDNAAGSPPLPCPMIGWPGVSSDTDPPIPRPAVPCSRRWSPTRRRQRHRLLRPLHLSLRSRPLPYCLRSARS